MSTLSRQILLDCTNAAIDSFGKYQDCAGCNGGDPAQAIQFISTFTIPEVCARASCLSPIYLMVPFGFLLNAQIFFFVLVQTSAQCFFASTHAGMQAGMQARTLYTYKHSCTPIHTNEFMPLQESMYPYTSDKTGVASNCKVASLALTPATDTWQHWVVGGG